MASDFPGTNLPDGTNFPSNTRFENRKAEDVTRDFLKLQKWGDRNSFLIDKELQHGYYDSQIFPNNNHLQGVQRLYDGRYIVYSGGIKSKVKGHLIFVKYRSPHFLNTQSVKLLAGPVGSNRFNDHHAYGSRYYKIFQLDEGNYWHCGGISSMGDVLVLPLENDINNAEKSKIIFLNVRNPENPLKYPTPVNRDTEKSGAATAFVMANGYVLLAVWTDSGNKYGNRKHRIDFYRSQQKGVDGSFRKIGTTFYDEIHNIPETDKGSYPKFQSFQFVQQNDGSLYLMGTFNTIPSLAIGNNKAYLFKVFTDASLSHQDPPSNKVPLVIFSDKKDFGKDRNYYNFAAAACTYINSFGELSMYAGPMNIRNRERLNFGEFCPPLKMSFPAINNLNQLRVELYEDENFKGRILRILGDQYIKLDDLHKVKIGHHSFDETTSSVKYVVPAGRRYTLYPRQGQSGPQGLREHLDGTGNVIEKPILEDTKGTASSADVSI